jgi:hypothetical protein
MIAHIGLPKTASTFLQSEYFSNLKGFTCYSPEFNLPNQFKHLFELNKPYDGVFAGDLIKVRYNHNINIGMDKDFINNSFGDQYILSSEGLTGVGFNYIATFWSNMTYLKKTVGIKKIIFIYRNQADYCESGYKQFVLRENRWKRLINIDVFWKDDASGVGNYRTLKWNRIILDLYDYFGKENVCALPFEYFQDCPRDFIGRLNDFIGSTPIKPINFSKKLNRHTNTKYKYRHKLYFWRNWDYEFDSMPERLRVEIFDAHKDENRMLDVITELDHKDYGYY